MMNKFKVGDRVIVAFYVDGSGIKNKVYSGAICKIFQEDSLNNKYPYSIEFDKKNIRHFVNRWCDKELLPDTPKNWKICEELKVEESI